MALFGTPFGVWRRAWTLALAAALACCLGAEAQARDDLAALDAYLRRHVRPISVTAQLEHCRQLFEDREDAEVLRGCYRYAALVLDEGLRLRRAAPGRSEPFEARLAAGAEEIASRLEALPTADREKLDAELRELDGAIRSLRIELSRVAALERMRISLVSRGGVSLGNWQAGFLYVLTEWAKTRPGQRHGPGLSDPAFSTVTGASAGAVNGLAAAIDGCKGPNPSAEESLYYQIWVGLGLFGRHGNPGLFPSAPGSSTVYSLFTKEALEATLAKATLHIENGGQHPSCVVDFGFVATHLSPTESPVHVRQSGDPILTTQKLKEKFTIRLESAGASAAGSVPRITNLGPPEAAQGDQLFYAGLGHAEEVPLDSLLAGVRASAAFPGAFPPVQLVYTQYVPGPDGKVLAREREATFIDGGVLDNTPVGLAVALDAWRRDSLVSPHFEGLLPAEPRTYVFLEPLVTSWARRGEPATAAEPEGGSMIATYLTFARDLLASTTDAQLANTAEQFSFVRRERPDWNQPRLSVPERHMPITGEQFDHFMAFLEQDFRIFDFYVGMADAHEYLEREACFFAPEGEPCEADGHLRDLDAALAQENARYRCIRAYYDSEVAHSQERIRTDRLPEECRTLDTVVCEQPGPPDSEEAVASFLHSGAVASESGPDGCFEPAIASHNFRALLAGMHNYKVWMQSAEYSPDGELDHFFEALSGEQPSDRFIYVDLPTHLGRDEGYLDSTEVRRGFRSLLQQGIDYVAGEQPGLEEYALKIVGRAAADAAYGRHYPRRILGLGVAQNGAEAVFGQRLGEKPWRWDSTFRFFNLQSQSYAPDLDPFTSEFYLSSQLTGILSPTGYLDVELGAGWALSETIAYDSSSPGHVAFRTGPRSYVALVLLQRLYLALNVDYYPVNEKAAAYQDVGTRVTDDWEFNLTGGWRFLY
jgi:predicted acylesterase/phospholipase RssA